MGKEKWERQALLKEYEYFQPEYTRGIQHVGAAEATTLAHSFLSSLKVNPTSVDVEMHAAFLAVIRYQGHEIPDGYRASGWVVGGNVPRPALNDNEIATPLEALAIYSLYIFPWLKAKGVESRPGELPDYRVPPDWSLLTFSPGYDQWRKGPVTSFISWILIRWNPDGILLPEIRASCIERAWIDPNWKDLKS